MSLLFQTGGHESSKKNLALQEGDSRMEGYIQPSNGPNSVQKKMISRKYGMFITFGINTFHNEEWTDGTKPVASYAPCSIDTDSWVRTAKDAGMKYVIFTAKHHDGFCLWNSRHTVYSVMYSSDKTDVLASLSRSCKKYGVELGIYYSLWDRNWGNGIMRPLKPPRMGEAAASYLHYMKKQLDELLAEYGPVCELWLDGGWVQPREIWSISELYRLTKKLQPNCAFGVNWTIGRPGNPDCHELKPEEQKEGYPIRYFPSDFRLGDPYLPTVPDPKCFSHGENSYYLPFESTVCLNDKWFFNSTDQGLKSVDELVSLYKQATAQNNIFVLNSPPNQEGKMPEQNIKRLREFYLMI